jgi:hypothetical protein
MSKIDPTTLPDERIDHQLEAFFKAAIPSVWPHCPPTATRSAKIAFWNSSVRRKFALAASVALLFLAQMWLATTFVGGERSSVSPNSPTEAHHRRTRSHAAGRIHNPPRNLDDRRGPAYFEDRLDRR